MGTNQVTDAGIEMLYDGLVSCRGTVRFMNFTRVGFWLEPSKGKTYEVMMVIELSAQMIHN